MGVSITRRKGPTTAVLIGSNKQEGNEATNPKHSSTSVVGRGYPWNLSEKTAYRGEAAGGDASRGG